MPRNWTDDEKTEIQTLSDEGLSLKEIGARFSVSDDTIRGVLRRKRGAEIEPRTTTDRLRAVHEKFDREVPEIRTDGFIKFIREIQTRPQPRRSRYRTASR